MNSGKRGKSLVDKLLLFICGRDLFEELRGDLEETYQWRVQHQGKRRAKLRYALDLLSALRFIPGSYIGFVSRSLLVSFLKSSFRVFLKHRLQTGLSLIGLSVGMATAIIILVYVSDELNYDRFSQSEDMYRVSFSFYRGEEMLYKTAVIGEPVAEALLNNLPQVEKAARLLDITRVWDGKNILTLENEPSKTFEEPDVYFADPEIMDLFDLKLIAGSERLNEPNTILLSKELAFKYFGGTDQAIGQVINFKSVVVKKDLLITGIYASPDFNLQVNPTALVSYSTNLKEGKNSIIPLWGANTCLTYIKTVAGTSADDLRASLDQFLDPESTSEDKPEGISSRDIFFDPVRRIHLHSDYPDEVGIVGNAQTVLILVIVACFIVFMAWINYINISTATAMKRSKEVGLRKVIGAKKGQLVLQFFTESALLNSIALVLALGMVWLIQPYFNLLVNRPLNVFAIDIDRFGPTVLGIFLLGIFFTGFYAAFSLSRQKIDQSLKGVLRGRKGLALRRGLIIFQLLFSSVLMIVSFTINEQIRYMTHSDLGLKMDDVLVLEGPTLKKTDSTHLELSQTFAFRLKRIANVAEVGIATSLPGKAILKKVAMTKENREDAEVYNLEYVYGSDFLDVLETNFIAGENFDPQIDEKQVILNVSALQKLGFDKAEDAIGETLYRSFHNGYGPAHVICGVIKDYHHESFDREIDPMVFYSSAGRFDNYYLLKLENEDVSAALPEIERAFTELFPGNPVNFYFLSDFYKRQYLDATINNRVFLYFVLVSVLIASLGLFGLTSFASLQRIKEIGVRKVFGADRSNLIFLLSKEVLILCAIGFVIAIPIAYLSIKSWLDSYAYQIQISPWLFALPILMVTLITLLSIAYNVLKAIRSSPINSLRYE